PSANPRFKRARREILKMKQWPLTRAAKAHPRAGPEHMIAPPHSPSERRLAQIDEMRRTVITERRPAGLLADAASDRAWIERSSRRCLAAGRRAAPPLH